MIGTKVVKPESNKNKLLKDLINSGCTYLFLYNDSIKIKDPLVFEHFKIVSDKTGFECMCMGSCEPSNQKPLYTNDPYVDYWMFPGTSFLFVTKNAIDKAGYMDEKFPKDTWEEVELIHRIGNLGLTAPFGMFVGIKDEFRYFDLDEEKIKERLKSDHDRMDTIKKATDYWQSKNPERFPNMTMPKTPDVKMNLRKGMGEL